MSARAMERRVKLVKLRPVLLLETFIEFIVSEAVGLKIAGVNLVHLLSVL